MANISDQSTFEDEEGLKDLDARTTRAGESDTETEFPEEEILEKISTEEGGKAVPKKQVALRARRVLEDYLDELKIKRALGDPEYLMPAHKKKRTLPKTQDK